MLDEEGRDVSPSSSASQLNKQVADTASASTIRQPWEFTDLDQEQFMASAVELEASGCRLAIETLVNAYEDDHDSWVSERNIYTDWRTGEVIYSHEPDEEAAPPLLASLVIVERRIGDFA